MVVRLLLLTALPTVVLGGKTTYSNNVICLQSYCINPLYPALDAMADLEKDSYECQEDFTTTRAYLDFCYAKVTYPFALPQAKDSKSSVPDTVNVQEQKAATYYAYHLAGMGYEFHDFMEPWDADDECVKAVWELTCFTLFPKCNEMQGRENFYLRPCKTSCHNYLEKCGVECCDESVQCVFNSEELQADGTSFKAKGYVDHEGPSPQCTGGGAVRGVTWSLTAAFFAVLAVALR